MKRTLLLTLGVILLATTAQAGGKGEKTGGATEAAAPDDNANEIHWLSIDEVQVKMKEHPKKVYMDVYTDWCGWCKRMDATTFKNADVVKYMNEKYYCVRFNAERTDDIRFAGKVYHYDAQHKVNELAMELMHGQLSYPTSIFMEEMFQNPQPVPGYHDVPEMEMISKFLGENLYKSKNFPDYQKEFKATWKS